MSELNGHHLTFVPRITSGHQGRMTTFVELASRVDEIQEGLEMATGDIQEVYQKHWAGEVEKSAVQRAKLERLPAILPHVFQGGIARQNLHHYTGNIAFDIDGIASEQEAIILYEKLCDDPHVCYVSLSISRRGVNGIMRTSACDVADNDRAWATVNRHLHEVYGYHTDQQTKNYNRGIYLTANPEVHIADNPVPLDIAPAELPEPVEGGEVEEGATSIPYKQDMAIMYLVRRCGATNPVLHDEELGIYAVSHPQSSNPTKPGALIRTDGKVCPLTWRFFGRDKPYGHFGRFFHLDELITENRTSRLDQFTLLPANEVMRQASEMPEARFVIEHFFKERQLGILFADTNLGKSWLATQIALAVASGTQYGFCKPCISGTVLFYDFELEKDDFAERYTAEDGTPMVWPDNLLRAEINYESAGVPDGMKAEDWYILNVEQAIQEHNPVLVVIDNLTFISSRLEEAKNAGPFIKELKALKEKYGTTILVLAHTPKIPHADPITINHLAGSKQLANFIDFCFCINRTLNGSGYQYVKQLKARRMEKIYEDEVLVVHRERDGAFMGFYEVETGNEHALLTPPTDNDLDLLAEDQVTVIREAYRRHRSQNATMEDPDVLELNLTRAVVRRVIRSYTHSSEWKELVERENAELARRAQTMYASGTSKAAIKAALHIGPSKLEELLNMEVDLTLNMFEEEE